MNLPDSVFCLTKNYNVTRKGIQIYIMLLQSGF